METKTIKGINDQKWMKFKIIAAKKRMPMGKLLELMIDNYEKNADKLWDAILYGEKLLSDKEAREMERTVKQLRQEKGFRQ